MLGTLAFVFRVALWLAIALDLDLLDPVKSQSNGFLWLVMFLATMIVLMVSGYLVGWVLNAFICQYIFRWPRAKVRLVFLNSHVPAAWLENDAEKLAIQYRNSWE
ncbi:MAG TPA: hypothetical protein VL754_18345, partial [Verrucomicrobiae bacterium]|nr:hypothetical protein [Verrucomicrobiae bacterium]